MVELIDEAALIVAPLATSASALAYGVTGDLRWLTIGVVVTVVVLCWHGLVSCRRANRFINRECADAIDAAYRDAADALFAPPPGAPRPSPSLLERSFAELDDEPDALHAGDCARRRDRAPLLSLVERRAWLSLASELESSVRRCRCRASGATVASPERSCPLHGEASS